MSETTIFQSRNARIICYDANRPRLVVGFDYRRMGRVGRADMPEQKPSAFFAKNNVAFLSIHSARNDWFLSPDLPAIRKVLHGFTNTYTHVSAIGFSMGGYGALLLAREIHANQVLLISPQSTVIRSRAPFETRFRKDTAALDPALDTLAGNPFSGLHGALLYDPAKRLDTRHANTLHKLFPNITPVPLPFAGHPAMRAISQAGLFQTVQKELLQDRLRPQEILRLHKLARRKSEQYQEGLSAYLQKRTARLPPE